MTDLRVIKRKKKYVILDYSNGRKQIKSKDHNTLTFKYKKEAQAYCNELSGAVIRKEIKLNDRFKFMDKFREYGFIRIAQAEIEGSRETVGGVSGYKSYCDKYLSLYFPEDKYLDETDGPLLESFVKNLKKAGVPHKTNVRIIQHIHTFLRWCLFKKLHHDFSSALEWKIGEHGSGYLLPDNDADLYETECPVIDHKEADMVLSYIEKHKDRSRNDALAYGIFSFLAIFGLRSSEILGLRKSSINFENQTVKIDKAFVRTGLAHKTKNRGSNRTLDFTTTQAKHLKWFFDYMFDARPHNKFLFAGSRGDGPIGSYTFRKLVWRTYEAVGLAQMKWFMKSNTEQYEVIESKYADFPTKTWRHYNATSLINNMKVLGLTPNYIKERVGHTRWTTTVDRYGNHNDQGNLELRQERAAKAEKALGYNNQ